MQACPPIRDEWKEKQYLAKIHEDYADEVIKKAEVGDLVFCFDEFDGEVILLEKPETNIGNCVYRNKEGEIRSCIVRLFRTLSKGKCYKEFHAKGENSEIRCQMIKRMAGQSGFRVRIEKTPEGHLIEVFGDSRQEVDDFFTLCVYNNFNILY